MVSVASERKSPAQTFGAQVAADYMDVNVRINNAKVVGFGTPNRYVNEPQFGTETMTMTPGREMQLSARLFF